MKEHLGAQGVSVENMIEAGLLISGDEVPVPYDRFRDRVMFPITDLRGRAIAFGGGISQKRFLPAANADRELSAFAQRRRQD